MTTPSPAAGSEQIAEAIYEATRVEAAWSERPIVPEPWEKRDDKFRNQFMDIIGKYLTMDKLPTPAEAHESWNQAYYKMGWKYGEVRDTEAKTHPDLVPFDELPQPEKDKDAIFLAFVWLARELAAQNNATYEAVMEAIGAEINYSMELLKQNPEEALRLDGRNIEKSRLRRLCGSPHLISAAAESHITSALHRAEVEARIDEIKSFGGPTVHASGLCHKYGTQFHKCVQCLKDERLAQLTPTKKETE